MPVDEAAEGDGRRDGADVSETPSETLSDETTDDTTVRTTGDAARARRFAGLPLGLLDRQVGFTRGTSFDPAVPCLWVRRRNPLERAFAWLLHRGETRLRVEVDRVSAWVLDAVPAEGTRPVVDIAHDLGVPVPDHPEQAALTGILPDEPHEGLVSFLVFLKQMVEGDVLRAEPI